MVTTRGTSTAKRSLSLSCREGKRMAKSARRLQAQVTAVSVTLTTVQPAELQALEVLLYHRQAATVAAEGQVKVMTLPAVPGPHRNVRFPKGAPQSVLSAKDAALLGTFNSALSPLPPLPLPSPSAVLPPMPASADSAVDPKFTSLG